ncbi:virion structural protein [Idiomarinaceae phage Phi1M2-2]|uniref:virion structural protein n=1 Tax=Idiomarinaceae phage Phi1M2-2 TaxID=1527515 RepID=UPI0004F5A13C|nr:virion structural protein [Idiomarinaceae phage Phi1M2-2]AIM40785.1 putative structural protein [Idiomarinaceae phage Phi1M2-2]
MEKYPSTLPRPLQSNYSRNRFDGARSVQPFAGGEILERTTFDQPATYTLTWQFSKGQALVFEAWLQVDLDGGFKPFEIDLLNEGGMSKQEVRFIAGSFPQLTSINADEMTYTANVFARKIENPYEPDYATIRELAEISPDGDPLQGMKLLDLAINVDWPEA